MRPTVRDKARARLTELDELGTIDESAYFVPPEYKGSPEKKVVTLAQENQAGRLQIMQARHWFHMTLQAENEDEAKNLFDKANGFYWEAMHNAKRDKARLTKLPELGGRPKSEDIDVLIELVDECSPGFTTLIAAVRYVLSNNPRLKMRYGDKDDDYLRKIMRERQKEKNRP